MDGRQMRQKAFDALCKLGLKPAEASSLSNSVRGETIEELIRESLNRYHQLAAEAAAQVKFSQSIGSYLQNLAPRQSSPSMRPSWYKDPLPEAGVKPRIRVRVIGRRVQPKPEEIEAALADSPLRYLSEQPAPDPNELPPAHFELLQRSPPIRYPDGPNWFWRLMGAAPMKPSWYTDEAEEASGSPNSNAELLD